MLSTRTIEAHVRNIYGKLGVRSRVELARVIEKRADTSSAGYQELTDYRARRP